MPNHNKIYTNQANMYERMISKQPNLSKIIEGIKPFEKLDVLDLGAGSGRLSEIIASKANTLICTDNSRSMLDILEKRVKAKNMTTIVADHRDLSEVESSSIDLVISGWSICYLSYSGESEWQTNLQKIMFEINRILRPKGTIIIFETLGTGNETPFPPEFLIPNYRVLEEDYRFAHRWVRTDYNFNNI